MESLGFRRRVDVTQPCHQVVAGEEREIFEFKKDVELEETQCTAAFSLTLKVPSIDLFLVSNP